MSTLSFNLGAPTSVATLRVAATLALARPDYGSSDDMPLTEGASGVVKCLRTALKGGDVVATFPAVRESPSLRVRPCP